MVCPHRWGAASPRAPGPFAKSAALAFWTADRPRIASSNFASANFENNKHYYWNILEKLLPLFFQGATLAVKSTDVVHCESDPAHGHSAV